ncbi:hypothetical protein AC579_7814 [Pseudocercospora musae]|uniref:F-box domain-containing protein n=1 Tax=Pseudocercospora musae TaxID=113226 RepID=A0A139IJD8_9PEZI|nr:hypothetical protein AC579_7814 [Pseudocercospora musae]
MSKPSFRIDGTRVAPLQRDRGLRQKDFALQPAASFLGLPQELRDHIYSYLLLKTKKLIYIGLVSGKKRPKSWRAYKRLSRVCNSVRVEVSKIFWAKNAFVINVGPKPPLLTADIMFSIKRLALRTAPYYFQPVNRPYDSLTRYEGILLLTKQADEGGYRVGIDRDPDFDSPEGLTELETQRRIVDEAMHIAEEAMRLLEDTGFISEDVLTGICWCCKQYSDRFMPVKQPNNRLCI